MADIFLKIFNMSISACWIVLAVLLLRIILKKAPKWINCILWGIAGLRLVMPFSFESVFSLIPSAEFVPPEMIHSHSSVDVSGAEILNYVGNNPVWYEVGISDGSLVFNEITAPDCNFVNPLLIITYVASIAWIVGIVILLSYTLISFLRLKKKIGTAVLLRDNIYQSEAVVSPFVLGIIKPKIYLPFNMSEQDMDYVIAHEQAHLRRKDHLWKPLGFLILTIHWFNPLVWLGYILLCRDIELACDEKVVKELSNEQKADYSQALLSCSVNRRMIAACPVAFGEVGVKDRVKSVLNYKKPAFWVIIVAMITSIAVAVCFLTNPRTTLNDELSVFIDMQIAEHHYSEEHTDDNFIAVHHKVLGVDKSLNETTVYMWVLYHEYSYENNEIKLESGAHIPTVITAERTGEHGHYKLVEYWEPRDGSLYAGDIREKFPWHLQEKAIDSQRYIDEQLAFCEAAAKEYFHQEAKTYSPVIDSATFDIDGDGKDENCALTYGPTSGLFTIVFTAIEVGEEEPEYINTFHLRYTGGSPEFYKSQNGEIKLKCYNNVFKNGSLNRTEDVFLDIEIENGNIVLKDGDENVAYWGEQGVEPTEFLRKQYALKEAVGEVVLRENNGKYFINGRNKGKYSSAKAFEAHEILHRIKDDEKDTLTVYAVALYEEFNLENGKVVSVGSGATPVEIVFNIKDDLEYTLKSYRVLEKEENIEDYIPEDRYYDDEETMEGLRQNIRIEAYDYYGIKDWEFDRDKLEVVTP